MGWFIELNFILISKIKIMLMEEGPLNALNYFVDQKDDFKVRTRIPFQSTIKNEILLTVFNKFFEQ